LRAARLFSRAHEPADCPTPSLTVRQGSYGWVTPMLRSCYATRRNDAATGKLPMLLPPRQAILHSRGKSHDISLRRARPSYYKCRRMQEKIPFSSLSVITDTLLSRICSDIFRAFWGAARANAPPVRARPGRRPNPSPKKTGPVLVCPGPAQARLTAFSTAASPRSGHTGSLRFRTSLWLRNRCRSNVTRP